MNVLVAEDDPVSRRLLESHLRRWGYDVALAQNGREAWEQFGGGDFSFVITDWMMPEMDGPDLIGRIRAAQRPRSVYVILLTATAQTEDLIAGMEIGADDFVTKPFDRDELRVRLRAGERILRLEHTLADQNRALREAQAALVQNEKLASLGQLAAGVAHEINNPVAFVTNNLAVLRRDVQAALRVLDRYRDGRSSLPPDLLEETAELEERIDLPYIQENLPRQFEASLDGLRRVRDIVGNLRDFARLDEAEFKAVDIPAALETTVRMVRFEVDQKQMRLETEFGETPPVLCHPGKMNQVFLNILMNAVQACDKGGVITIRTRGEADGTAAVVEFEDNGTGIRPQDLPHIFDPFFTTKPVGQGTGLGLSISYGIVRDHGGQIEVDTEPGRGSVFRVCLPCHPPQAQEAAAL